MTRSPNSNTHTRPERRRFLKTAALGLGAGLLSRFSDPACAAQRSSIDVLVDEPGARIAPELYGHFLEHCGTVIYDGVWVGETSKIPNVGGIRTAFIEGLRNVKAPIIRWPGGGFAESYDWTDGIGPPTARPRRVNPYADFPDEGIVPGPQDYESNHFGTPEFMRLCRLTGSQAYLAANVRSLGPMEFRRWVEYCNAPRGTTALAELRAANGSADPYNVKYWGIGNEQWIYLTADEYAEQYRRFTQSVSRNGVELKFIAGGPITDNFLPDAARLRRVQEWISKLLEPGVFGPDPPFGITLHYYTLNLSGHPSERMADYLRVQGSDVQFNAPQWYELLRQSDQIGALIESYWSAMAEQDPQHQSKLIVDEWGTYYHPATKLNAANLQGHAVTLRDALASALTLDTFNRHCDKVAMANISFTINALNSLFLAQEEQFVTTPIYHVFQMYAAHQGAQQVRCVFNAPSVRYDLAGQSLSMWGLNGSASLRGRELTLTVVNPHVSEPHEATIALRGAQIKDGTLTTLTHRDIHAQNTFETPQAVRPVTTELITPGSNVNVVFPPASVNSLKLVLR